jgi:hypothetical protein
MGEDRQGIIWSVVVFAAWFLLVYALFFSLHGATLRYENDLQVLPNSGDVLGVPSQSWDGPIDTWITSLESAERASFQRMSPDLFGAYYPDLANTNSDRVSTTIASWSLASSWSPLTLPLPDSSLADVNRNGWSLWLWSWAVGSWMLWNTPQPVNVDWKLFHSTQQLFGQYIELPDVQGKKVMLPDTFVWVPTKNPLRSLSILWLTESTQYILKDVNNTHFIYFGSYFPPFSEIVRSLWWNLVEIRTQNAIRESTLFWEFVQLFTLPQHPTKQFIVATFGQGADVWLLQVDLDYYENPRHKTFIQEKFRVVYWE